VPLLLGLVDQPDSELLAQRGGRAQQLGGPILLASGDEDRRFGSVMPIL
jgi:hypothetical protein